MLLIIVREQWALLKTDRAIADLDRAGLRISGEQIETSTQQRF